MKPACLVDNKPSQLLYIDAEGDFYPCCWIGTYRYKYKSLFSPKQNKLNIADNTIDGILDKNDVKISLNQQNNLHLLMIVVKYSVERNNG